MKGMLLAAVAAMVFSGCADPIQYEIRGSFTADRDGADLAEFEAKVASLEGELVLLESFPEQFIATFQTEDDCDAMHNFVHLRSYIDQSVDNHCQIV